MPFLSFTNTLTDNSPRIHSPTVSLIFPKYFWYFKSPPVNFTSQTNTLSWHGLYSSSLPNRKKLWLPTSMKQDSPRPVCTPSECKAWFIQHAKSMTQKFFWETFFSKLYQLALLNHTWEKQIQRDPHLTPMHMCQSWTRSLNTPADGHCRLRQKSVQIPESSVGRGHSEAAWAHSVWTNADVTYSTHGT